MAKRTCIFCGAVEVSDEHVFSKWLKDVMPDVASQTKSSHTGGTLLSAPPCRLRLDSRRK
jgi:hypothetical protein